MSGHCFGCGGVGQCFCDEIENKVPENKKCEGGGGMKCPTCHREWSKKTEQAVCIETFGVCIVCRYRDHMPVGMTQLRADQELTEMEKESRNRMGAGE